MVVEVLEGRCDDIVVVESSLDDSASCRVDAWEEG